MSNIKRRRWTIHLRRIITAVFAVGFCFSLINTFNIQAASNIFKLQDAKLEKLTDTVEGDITDFNELTVATNVTFHKLNDAVKYTLTIKNSDKNDCTINSITDENDNNYISYEYDSYENTTVAANSTFDFIITATYKNALNNINERSQTSNVKFIIHYNDGQEEKEEEVPLVPDTSDNNSTATPNAIRTNTVTLIISAIGLIICIILAAKKHKEASKLVAILTILISAITLTTSAKALKIEINTIAFTNSYSLEDKELVTYKIGDQEETEIVSYGEKITKNSPKKAGNTFVKWVLEDGTDFNTETKITKDTVLIAKFAPSSMALDFRGNGLSFANGKISSIIEYKQTCHEEAVPTIAHTSNLNDDGTRKHDEDDNEMNYPDDAAEKIVISVPGATKLKINVKYSIENGYDELYIFNRDIGENDPSSFDPDDGPIRTISAESDDYNSFNTDVFEINGNTATFFFHSDGSVNYYGYFATIEGYDINNQPIGNTTNVCENSVVSGSYLEPETSDTQVFYGWSLNQNATQPDFKTLKEAMEAVDGELGKTVNIYAVWEERESFIIKMHGNGLTFDNNSEVNSMRYISKCNDIPIPLVKYSHTSNIDDSGNNNGNYSNNLRTADVITFDNASSLRITTTYATESGYDYVYIFKGNYSGSISSSLSGHSAIYNGGNYTQRTATVIIPGNTATIVFYSDGSSSYYGYYSVIEPLDESGNVMSTNETVKVCDTERISGTYRAPTTAENQQFFGWAESPDAAYPEYLDEQEIETNIQGEDGETKDLYAFWVKLHTVHFDGNGADSGSMDDQKVYGGYPNTLSSNDYNHTNYTFLGWSTNKDATEPEYEDGDTFTAPNNYETTTFYAVWKKKVHIIYDGNGATSGSMSDSYYDAGSTFTLTSNRYSRSNYDFLGWSTDKDAIIPAYVNQARFTTPTNKEEITLYAIWTTKHHIVFDGNGADSGSMSAQYYTRGSTINLPSNSYAKSKYMFLGWSTNKDAIIPQYTDVGRFVVPTDTDETTLYAIWVKQFVIHFDGNGATSGSMGDRIIAVGGTINLPDNAFTKTNSVFTGWSEDKDALVGTYANQASFTAPTDEEGTTLYAIWRQKPVVHFDGNGSTSGTMSDQVFEFDTAANLRNNSFYRTNYTFLGWSEDSDATEATYANQATFTPSTSKDETTLYAIWKKKFAIHFDINGGENGTMTDQYVEWTSVSTTLNINQFTKPKYYVDGWSTDKDASEPTYADGGTFTLPTDGTTEITLYAIWKPAYTVHFHGGDDVEGDMISYKWDSNEVEGEATTMIKKVGTQGMLVSPNYSKTGYGFAGWSEDPDAASRINNTSNKPIIYGPNENITLTASFASTATEEGDLNLYAVWLPAETEYTLQTFNKTAFEAAYPNKNIIALRDERDNNVYAVAKIAGGYWWMMENLRLNFADSNTTITAANTNNPSSSFITSVNRFKGRTDYQNFFKECTAQNASCYDTVSFSVDNIIRKYNPYYGPTPPVSNINRKPNQSWYSYGAYYNWYTAVAGTLGTYSNNSYEIPAGGKPQTASGDICPSGWKLPNGGATGDYSNMNVALGGTQLKPYDSNEWYTNGYSSVYGESFRWFKYPVNAIKSGVRSEAGTGGYHNQGAIYSSPSFASTGSMGTYLVEYIDQFGRFQDRSVIGGYHEIRGNSGFAVRCIAK